jgi:hypothetical protein
MRSDRLAACGTTGPRQDQGRLHRLAFPEAGAPVESGIAKRLCPIPREVCP